MTGRDEQRHEYHVGVLSEAAVDRDPLRQFRRWLDEAVAARLPEPTAVTLATVDADGMPDARVVLLRGIDDRGVRWFTNRRSAKGRQLAANPSAAIAVHWQPLERQVRIRGRVEALSDEESDAYFATRPRASRLSAIASRQSEPIADRAALEARIAAVEQRHADDDEVPRPSHWGGYLLRPDSVEFWQGRPARLHDRLVYRRSGTAWRLERLQP